MVRPVSGNTPENAPLTVSRYAVTAPPVSGGLHPSESVRPLRSTASRSGGPGTPVQAAGNVRVSVFDGALLPAALVATTWNVYVPGGTLAYWNDSAAPSGTTPLTGPLTTSETLAGAPPANVGVHESASDEPWTVPRRCAG